MALSRALELILHCERCNTFSEKQVCALCRSPRRDAHLLCVVETPADMLMMEQAECYQGLYFVLMGRLSPLDGIGPKDIHLDRLLKRADDGQVREVIVATNFTVEGEATAHYVGELLLARGLKVSRIARGLPVGGELEHVDSGTLAQAVIERRVARVIAMNKRAHQHTRGTSCQTRRRSNAACTSRAGWQTKCRAAGRDRSPLRNCRKSWRSPGLDRGATWNC